MKFGALETMWASAVICFGLIVVLFGFGVIAYQGVLWLQHGTWTPLELRLGWQWLWSLGDKPAPEPEFSWLGVQKVALWILESPLSVGIMVLGCLIFLWGSKLEGEINAEKAEYRRKTGNR